MLHGSHRAFHRSDHVRSQGGSTRVFEGAANCSTGVIAPFIVQTTSEAKAAPQHTCLRRRGKLLRGSHRAFHRSDHVRSRGGSTAHVSSKARQNAPRESSRLSSFRPRQKPRRLHSTHVFEGAAKCSTGVIALFIVQTTSEAEAAPQHTCLRRRGKMLHGSHRAFHRSDHVRSRGGSTAHVSSKARQIAPRESSHLSSFRPHQKPRRLHCTHISQGVANCSTGVIAPFIVQTTSEAEAATLHTCLQRRGKMFHGSHRAFRRQDHTGRRSGSTALVSPMAREMTRAHSHTQKAQRFLCLCLAFFVAFSSSCCSSRRRASALRSAKVIPASSASRWAVSTSIRATAFNLLGSFNLCKQLRHILMRNMAASFRGR